MTDQKAERLMNLTICLLVARNFVPKSRIRQVVEAYRDLGVDASPPRLYPEYAADYYATFFPDPDGIRLEIVAHRRMRTLIREHWAELTEFEDPVSKAGLA